MAELTADERAALEARLARYQARHDEIVLGSATSISHSNQGGSRSITYGRADVAAIEAEIRRLQALLGIPLSEFGSVLRPLAIGLY